MTPQELTAATLAYLAAVGPFLLIFLALSSTDRIIDLIYKAFGYEVDRYV